MTHALRYALVADGPTDRVLRHVIDWSVRDLFPAAVIREPGFVGRGGADLRATILEARRRHEPDVVIVHRDAEREDPATRRSEITAADAEATPVVPVRMTEAWLLIDERALRRAAGNPTGRTELGLPAVRRLEDVADPKETLHAALLAAADLAGPRRRRRFARQMPDRIDRLGALIATFAPLRCLPAFRDYEARLKAVLERILGRA